jgi:hypothetical protein
VEYAKLLLASAFLLLSLGCSAQASNGRFVDNRNAISVGGYDFGFTDGGYDSSNAESDHRRWCQMHLGPLGEYDMPFSAGVGWVLTASLIWLGISILGFVVFKRDRMRNNGGRSKPQTRY